MVSRRAAATAGFETALELDAAVDVVVVAEELAVVSKVFDVVVVASVSLAGGSGTANGSITGQNGYCHPKIQNLLQNSKRKTQAFNKISNFYSIFFPITSTKSHEIISHLLPLLVTFAKKAMLQ